MITLEQIDHFSQIYKIDESVIAREFLQILFLNELYSKDFSRNLFFKGGTCIRLIYGGKRFSEDLDFTVNMDEDEFSFKLNELFGEISKKYSVRFKEKRTLSGRTSLLTATIQGFKTPLYIKLDFSFRESVLEPDKVILKTDYPIVISNFIFCMSKNEIIAEKVRAIMTRNKLRDLYDLWILQELGGRFDISLINRKLAYYNEEFSANRLIERLNSFNKKEYVTDLRPFVPISDRDKLEDQFEFTVQYVKSSLDKIKSE